VERERREEEAETDARVKLDGERDRG